jgi:hypothetical protein
MKHLRLGIAITLVKSIRHYLQGSRKGNPRLNNHFASQPPSESTSNPELRMKVVAPEPCQAIDTSFAADNVPIDTYFLHTAVLDVEI